MIFFLERGWAYGLGRLHWCVGGFGRVELFHAGNVSLVDHHVVVVAAGGPDDVALVRLQHGRHHAAFERVRKTDSGLNFLFAVAESEAVESRVAGVERDLPSKALVYGLGLLR